MPTYMIEFSDDEDAVWHRYVAAQQAQAAAEQFPRRVPETVQGLILSFFEAPRRLVARWGAEQAQQPVVAQAFGELPPAAQHEIAAVLAKHQVGQMGMGAPVAPILRPRGDDYDG